MTERTMAERDAEREPGLYWVLKHDEWSVAEWVRGFAGYPVPWLVIGSDGFFYSEEFTEIDERPIVRES